MKTKTSTLKQMKRRWLLYLMVLPALASLLIFSYKPMYGLIIAFKDFNFRLGYLGSEWVGLKWFIKFLKSPNFGLIFKNTIILSLYSKVVSFPIPIVFALILNALENKKYKSFAQTVTYLPHFISMVVMISILQMIFSPVSGIYGNVYRLLGGEGYPADFRGLASSFRHLYVWSGVWQNMGWSAIIYIAAIAGINPEHYEAATIDGAGRLQRTWYITLPGIAGTIIVMLIFEISGILNSGMDALLVLQNDLNYYASETIDFYVYHVGIGNFRYSYATAIGLLKSIVGLILLLTANFASKKLTDRGLF